MSALLLAFAGCGSLVRSLSQRLDAEPGRLEWRHFPDGESLVTIASDCSGRDVVLVATLRDPDRLAMPLLFASRTARELGARSVAVVAPYLGYLRQDARFVPGQAVSSTHFCAYLADLFDAIVTVDPHLHRHADLGALTGGRAEAVSSVPIVAEWIGAHVANPVLIGPDAESAQWLEPLGRLADAPIVVLAKERKGDLDVRVSPLSPDALQGRTPVLFDDIVSSGQTMIRTLARLRDVGATPPVCIAVHGVFSQEADRWLRVAGAAGVVTTNTIEHATNAIDVAPALAPAIARRLRGC